MSTRCPLAGTACPVGPERTSSSCAAGSRSRRKVSSGSSSASPTRIGIDLCLDELSHRAAAIAHEPQAVAACRRHQPPANDQQAMLITADVALDDDFTAFGLGHHKGGTNVGFLLSSATPPGMVGIAGLDHHQQAYVLRHC